MREYLCTLSDSTKCLPTLRRVKIRDSQAEAVDAAVRWLRLARRINPAAACQYDRWTVAVLDDLKGWLIVATGGPDDSPQAPPPTWRGQGDDSTGRGGNPTG